MSSTLSGGAACLIVVVPLYLIAGSIQVADGDKTSSSDAGAIVGGSSRRSCQFSAPRYEQLPITRLISVTVNRSIAGSIGLAASA